MVWRPVILVFLTAMLGMPCGFQAPPSPSPLFSAGQDEQDRGDNPADLFRGEQDIPFRLTSRDVAECGLISGNESIPVRDKLREASLIRVCPRPLPLDRLDASNRRRIAPLNAPVSGRNRPLQV